MSDICRSWLNTLGAPGTEAAEVTRSAGSVSLHVEIALTYAWSIQTSLQPGRWGPGRAEFRASKAEARTTLQQDAGLLWNSIKSALPIHPEQWQQATKRKLHFAFPKPYGVELTCPNCAASGRVTCGGCSGTCVQTCHSCSGRGKVRCQSCSGHGSNSHREPNQTIRNADGSTSTVQGRTIEVPCGACAASGTQTCFPCGGDGRVRCGSCGGAGTVQCPTCLSYGFVTETLAAEMEVTSNASVLLQSHPDALAISTVSSDLDVTLRNARLRPLTKVVSERCAYHGECAYIEFRIRYQSDCARVIAIGDAGEVVRTEGHLVGLSSVISGHIGNTAKEGVVELLLLADASGFVSNLVASVASDCNSKLVRTAVKRRCQYRLSSQERALHGLIPEDALGHMHSSVLTALNSLESQLRTSLLNHVKFGVGGAVGLTFMVATAAAAHHSGVGALQEALGPWSNDIAQIWVFMWAGAATVVGSIVGISLWWRRSRMTRFLSGRMP